MPARGDVKTRLLDTEYVLRPSFQAITLMEEYFSRGIIDIARDYHNGKVTHARDFIAIIHAGLRGAGQEPPDNLDERVVATGLAQLIEPCGLLLAHACGIRG